jgi:hypothetical protein
MTFLAKKSIKCQKKYSVNIWAAQITRIDFWSKCNGMYDEENFKTNPMNPVTKQTKIVFTTFFSFEKNMRFC